MHIEDTVSALFTKCTQSANRVRAQGTPSAQPVHKEYTVCVDKVHSGCIVRAVRVHKE